MLLRTRCGHSGPLVTLATNAYKASCVKRLNIEFSRGASGTEEEDTMERFLSAATLMCNLKDLHVRLRENLKHHFKKLNEMLWCVVDSPPPFEAADSGTTRSGGHFQLNCLIIAECLDLRRLIEKHPHLRVLGIYVTTKIGPPPLISSLDKRPLMVVALGDPCPRWFGIRYTRGPFYKHLIFLPELLTLDQARNFGDLFHHYFKTDTQVAITLDPEEIVGLSIHIQEVPSQEVYGAFVESITPLFPKVRSVQFYLTPGLVSTLWTPRRDMRLMACPTAVEKVAANPTSGRSMPGKDPGFRMGARRELHTGAGR